MLRITIAETVTEQRWTLEGRLVEPWVAELRTYWKKRHRAQNGRTCTVDLSAVTFIDTGGQRLLRTMSKEGPNSSRRMPYIKRVLDQLKPDGSTEPPQSHLLFVREFDVSVREPRTGPQAEDLATPTTLDHCRCGFTRGIMEVLDTSIANVAMPEIAGNLGASNDESTWVLTSDLVSNAIVFSGDHFGNASAKHGRSERHRYDRGHRDQGACARHQRPVDCAGQRKGFAATADPISDRRSQRASETVNLRAVRSIPNAIPSTCQKTGTVPWPWQCQSGS